MDATLLELFRRWLSHKAILGFVLSIPFAYYVVLPAAMEAEQRTVQSLAVGFERAARRAEQQSLVELRRAEHSRRKPSSRSNTQR